LYAGYIGGNDDWDTAYDIVVDTAGSAYVTGGTYSTETSFPVTIGPDLTFNGGWTDAYVAKVRSDGMGLDYCCYIGGSGDWERGRGVALDADGSLYVTGYTNSTEATFPVTVGPDLTFNGDYDVFVAKVATSGVSLDYCGYIGGSDEDRGRDIAADLEGNAYITGLTGSTEETFPETVGPDLTYNGEDYLGDAFVAKVVFFAPAASVYLPLVLRNH
jgi:Beta-propeller repeat